MTIACFGDSLTYGNLGHSYIKFLNPSIKIINEGLNGDTTVCMHTRLKQYLAKPSSAETDFYIIAIGTNDLLLPYLTTVSPVWEKIMGPRVKYKKCLQDSGLFKSEYEKILQTVISTGKRALVLGLPYLQLRDYPNDSVDERNRIIQNLTAKFGVPNIDVTEIQRNLVGEIAAAYSWDKELTARFTDGILFPLFERKKDALSEKRGLALTTDGVHWNSTMARAVAAAVTEYII